VETRRGVSHGLKLPDAAAEVPSWPMYLRSTLSTALWVGAVTRIRASTKQAWRARRICTMVSVFPVPGGPHRQVSGDATAARTDAFWLALRPSRALLVYDVVGFVLGTRVLLLLVLAPVLLVLVLPGIPTSGLSVGACATGKPPRIWSAMWQQSSGSVAKARRASNMVFVVA
jgi:hypothetical protein